VHAAVWPRAAAQTLALGRYGSGRGQDLDAVDGSQLHEASRVGRDGDGQAQLPGPGAG